MTKVIQVRGVSDDVHARLREAAAADGKSLTAYVGQLFEEWARRRDAMAHNRRITQELRDSIGVIDISREQLLQAIDEGRMERDAELDRAIQSQRS